MNAQPQPAHAVPTLDDLAQVAGREHQLCVQATGAALAHAIAAGEALNEAKARVPSGEWQAWLREHFPDTVSHTTLRDYMRIARHRDIVEASGQISVVAATRMLSRQEYGRRGLGGGPAPQSIDAQVLSRVKRGEITQREAGDLLGVNQSTISARVNPRAQKARQRRQRAARRALRAQERAAAAQKVGGALGEAYASLRRTLQAAERALDEAQSREVKEAVGTAIHRMHAAEDELAKAVRLS